LAGETDNFSRFLLKDVAESKFTLHRDRMFVDLLFVARPRLSLISPRSVANNYQFNYSQVHLIACVEDSTLKQESPDLQPNLALLHFGVSRLRQVNGPETFANLEPLSFIW
jgi:hypothetical protein